MEVRPISVLFRRNCRFISKIPSGATLHKKVCQRNPNKILHPLRGTIGKPCSEQHKEILRNLYKTKKHPRFGGYQKNAGHSKKFKVLDSLGVEVSLQSSYEKLMQEWLDSKNIIWNRPSYLRYDDKKYFPDFYLPEYDIYIDTKNEYLAKIDKPKLDKVIEQCNVNILLVLKNEINDSLLQRFTPVV